MSGTRRSRPFSECSEDSLCSGSLHVSRFQVLLIHLVYSISQVESPYKMRYFTFPYVSYTRYSSSHGLTRDTGVSWQRSKQVLSRRKAPALNYLRSSDWSSSCSMYPWMCGSGRPYCCPWNCPTSRMNCRSWSCPMSRMSYCSWSCPMSRMSCRSWNCPMSRMSCRPSSCPMSRMSCRS